MSSEKVVGGKHFLRPAMRIIAFDPSSKKTGYAVLDGLAPEHLIDAGILKPSSKAVGTVERIDSLCADIPSLFKEHHPDAAVVEITSGHVSFRHKGGGAGLAIYGMAIWAVLAKCRECLDAKAVYAVEENTWTRRVPKARRAAGIAYTYPSYAKVVAGDAGRFQDAGGDVADAVGLGRWWLVANGVNMCKSCG